MTYSSLTEGQMLSGFRTSAVYLNDSDQAIGARFIHERSGFTLDVLGIQSVPQAFVWVTTYPTSNMGEPHTQEHLLLGKGNAGRTVANQEAMSLASSSAFTSQWLTCYHFYTAAGSYVFYSEFERRLDALLHPDYTDEEVRREVRNFGITQNPVDGSLGLEEKGSVYNEMVTSMDQPTRRLYMTANTMIYGEDHPLAYNSGGTPEALRRLQPSDIRKFHTDNYHLANMGAILSIPSDMDLENALSRLNALLTRVQPQKPNRPVRSEKNLPGAKPAPAGEIRKVEYPHRNPQQPGQVRVVWQADRKLDTVEQTLLSLFLESFAGDATTNLYKKFIDSRTRDFDIGAQSVFSGFEEYGGFPVTVGFGDVPAAKMNDADMSDLRSRILGELERIRTWKDGSPEVQEFNERIRSRILETRRNLAKFVNTPPGFGFRGTGYDWLAQLNLLNKERGFRKSITMKSVLDAVEKKLADNRNVWAQYLPKWKLTGAKPWVLTATPNPDLIAEAQKDREIRVDAEFARLRAVYRTADDQAALARYRADYDAATAVIEAAANDLKPPKFVDNPPMTLDDQLIFTAGELKGGIPFVVSTFESMTSGTTGLALHLDGVPEDQLLYVSALPQLLTRVGVVENGRVIPYEEMSERLRKEILGLGADFSTNPRTGRVELVIRGSGNDASESRRAIRWMQLALFSVDWRPENLPRIRDVVDQMLGALRRTTQTAEENWVRGVATAYWRQDNPAILAASSFLTQSHNVLRLRWRLMEGTPQARAEAADSLLRLADLRGSRAELSTRLAEMKAGSDKLMAEAAKDLDLTLPDLPDSSLAADWSQLCREMAEDLRIGPESALAALTAVRTGILRTGNARAFMTGSPETQQAVTAELETLAASLHQAPSVKAAYDTSRRIAARLLQREPAARQPVFVGLLNPNSQGGVFVNSAPGPVFEDTDRDRLIDYLALSLYSGGGGHSLFMKTWGAGLAYSNGIGTSLSLGRISYYAERTPELPQTMRFVVEQIRQADYDPALVDYTVAQAFSGTRSASSYETRGEAIAANLADGLTPSVVSRFHERILDLRSAPDLPAELFRRVGALYARVLPGLGPPMSQIEDGVYFVIGPEKQFSSWESYLQSIEGPDAQLFRLYPRDFWM